MSSAAPPEAKLRIETPSQGIRLLVIDRPSRRNALDVETYEMLTHAVQEADRDPAIRAIVVTGAKGSFTAGNDLADFQGTEAPGAAAAMAFLHAINRCETPLIGAVEGHAVGIGVTMLLHFDFAFAARGAKMRMPFVPLGLSPEGGSSYLIPKIAGLKRATELLLLGELFDGAKAAESRIVTAAVEDGTALDHALAVAAKIAALPPESVRVAKHLIRRGDQMIIDETIDYEAERFRERRASPEAQAAFAAFFAKAK
ncbi:MAG: enoyl-CoA hydratase [Rhizobiales bacterium 65-9]|nr:enoyl-CoA hydratase/isomerase family protein [Hyphomicrobiales bacterium]OJY36486.1 MAG: enoyl-CoA hydratase [Rhizobiales bacterium 65-9]